MGHSRLTMLSEFQVDSRGTQPYTHMYSFSPKRLSHPDCRTSNSYRVQWLLKVPHDLLQVQISLCGRATVLKEWRRWEIQAQRVCVWTHSGWETRHQGQTPGHSYTVIPYRETKPGSPHWKQEVRSGSTWHPRLLQTIQPRIINHLTPKMKEETDIILLQTGYEFRCEFRKVCSLKEILKCPESILGYPRVFHLNDQEDKAISSIAFFFFLDLRWWKMYSVLSLLQNISTVRTSLGVLPWWGVEWGVVHWLPQVYWVAWPSQDPRDIPFHLQPAA